MALIVEDGVEGLTIARLAHRVGSSVGALYRYFVSKEALLVGLQEMAIADVRLFLDERVAAVPAHGSARVVALARLLVATGAYLEHAEASPRLHRLVDLFLSAPDPLLSDDEAREITIRVVGPILEAYGMLLVDAVNAGALTPGDARQRTHLAWAFVHGLDHFRKRDRLNPPELQVRALLPMAQQTLLAGWGADEAALREANALLQAMPVA